MSGKDLQDQAKYIWDRLEDLSANDPQGYKKFIDEQMKEREIYMKPPKPELCFKCQQNNGGPDVYVNICSWLRIPYPENDDEPLKLMCGFLKRHVSKKGGGRYITIPVAANERVLDEILSTFLDKNELINLIIELASKQCKVNLNKNYEICKDLYKGDLPANPIALFVKNPMKDMNDSEFMKMAEENIGDILSSPESLLKNLNIDEENLPADKEMPDLIKKATQVKAKVPPKKLIEEIVESLPTPEYFMFEDDTEERRITVTINLPLATCVAECDLILSQNELELTVPEKYYLKLPLNKLVNDDFCKAKFSKKSKQLIIKVPLL